jgi:crotonobetainyl-CoA:carnitine CoA-transferase CaiB-like acyl-CoA transferase
MPGQEPDQAAPTQAPRLGEHTDRILKEFNLLDTQ